MLCAGIAAAGVNCVDAAAQRAWSVVAEIGSSKLIAGVSTDSAISPRYRGCCGGRARRRRRRRGGMNNGVAVGFFPTETFCIIWSHGGTNPTSGGI